MAPPATMTSSASMVCVTPSGVDVLDPGGPPALGDDAAHVGLGHQLGPPRRHGLGQQRHRVALGVDRAAEEGAEAAVVAGRPAVVGDAVGRRRRLVGVQADLLGGGRRQHRAVHRRARRHRVRARPPGGERVGALAARTRRWPARPRRSTARARRSRAASRRRRRPPAARRSRGAGSPPPGSAAPCRRRGCRRRRPSSGWSSPRRRACARPRPPSGGRPAARPAGRGRGSSAR